MLASDDPAAGSLPYCYLTTTGRVSQEPRTIEIWFALEANTAYLMAGGREKANWVRNLRRQPRVSIKIGERELSATARLVSDAEEDALVRRLLLAKYAPTYSGDLSEWGRTALPVAIDLDTSS